MVLSCTVSEIRRLIGWKLRIFHTPLLFGAHAPYVPFEFRGEVRHGKTRVMGLPCGVSFMILASTVFEQSTRVTDGPPDVQTTYTRYSIYAVARKVFLQKPVMLEQKWHHSCATSGTAAHWGLAAVHWTGSCNNNVTLSRTGSGSFWHWLHCSMVPLCPPA